MNVKIVKVYMFLQGLKKYFDAYYTEGEASKYWATTFYKATEKNRTKMLWKPKAKMIKKKIETFAPDTKQIIDIGGGYGLFMIEFLKLLKIDHLVIEPSKYLSAACEQKGLKTLVKFLENAKKKDFINNKKTFVSFELF